MENEEGEKFEERSVRSEAGMSMKRPHRDRLREE